MKEKKQRVDKDNDEKEKGHRKQKQELQKHRRCLGSNVHRLSALIIEIMPCIFAAWVSHCRVIHSRGAGGWASHTLP